MSETRFQPAVLLVCFISVSFFFCMSRAADVVEKQTAAPILDIEAESSGYSGTIGEHSVLVDLKPHLQIKNIDSISNLIW